jgi:hypothetical protein
LFPLDALVVDEESDTYEWIARISVDSCRKSMYCKRQKAEGRRQKAEAEAEIEELKGLLAELQRQLDENPE